MRRTITLATTLLILAAGGLAPVAGEPLEVVGGETLPGNGLLRVVWQEREGDWQGAWSPADRSGSGAYHGVWRKGRERATAELMITIDGTVVTVVRTQPEGTCNYHGNLAVDRARRTVRVAGYYRCAWAPRTMSWSAVISG